MTKDGNGKAQKEEPNIFIIINSNIHLKIETYQEVFNSVATFLLNKDIFKIKEKNTLLVH